MGYGEVQCDLKTSHNLVENGFAGQCVDKVLATLKLIVQLASCFTV